MEELIEKASAWTDTYLNLFALRKNPDIKGAAFIFTSWAVWDYCLNQDCLPEGEDVAGEYICSTLVYSGFNDKIDIAEFVDVFKTRFKIFKSDIKGLLNSDYPRTKQYLPFGTYCSIYRHQLSLNPTSGVDPYDYETNEELVEFTGGLIKFWNILIANMEESFK